jgi:hypothetical protein
MFKRSTNNEIIQVVTDSDNKKELESIGFVDHVDKAKAVVKKTVKAKKNAN